MNVQGADILSDVTEKTSRNLKATAAIVMAVKLFDVPQDLHVLGVDLKANLFDVVSLVLIGYMMIVLVPYWGADYLLWRNGPLLIAKDILDRLGNIKDSLKDVEPFTHRSGADNVKVFEDHFGAMRAWISDSQRSIRKTTWWVRLVIFGLHLIIPYVLGALALWMVWKDAWAAICGLL